MLGITVVYGFWFVIYLSYTKIMQSISYSYPWAIWQVTLIIESSMQLWIGQGPQGPSQGVP